MTDVIGALIFAIMAGLLGFFAAVGIYVLNPTVECEREHNVYACEMVAVPIQPKPVLREAR